MILQALVDYYNRASSNPDSGMPPLGWEWRPFAFLVVISKDGIFLRFEDTREKKEKHLEAKEFLVPSLGEKKGGGIKANLLWENFEYMFGIPAKKNTQSESKRGRVGRQHECFKKRISDVSGENNLLLSVKKFLDNVDVGVIQGDTNWPEIYDGNFPLLLAVSDLKERIVVTDDIGVRKTLSDLKSEGGLRGRCLVSGCIDEIVSLEPPIRGVRNASPMGAGIIAINNEIRNGVNGGETPAFASFLKNSGLNSPVGRQASLSYTTALNHLLRYDSRQRIQIGDATTVFWGDKENQMEPLFRLFFIEPEKGSPPDAGTQAVKALFDAIKSGRFQRLDADKRFYVLGLAPNVVRLSVRFWIHDTVPGIAQKIALHFSDLEIICGPKEREYFSLWRILVSTAPQGKTENISPSLAGSVCRSILESIPYPAVLFQAVVGRIKVEHEITHVRAAVVKACLNRQLRYSNLTQEKELTVSLDTTNTNVGYRLGRLFAVLEQIQERANPGINATIRDKFYAGASATPSIVFPNLMRLKNYYLSKVDNPGFRISREKLIGEIADGISEFPAHLALADQGRFAVGYYHQRQDFFTKKQND